MDTNKITRITQPVIDRVMTHSGFDYVIVKDRALELMYAIQKELDIFEPIEDDECRLIWLEIPRGTLQEWKQIFDENEDPTAEEEQEFLEDYPQETEWIFLTTGTYRECTSLRISNRDWKGRIFCNEDRSSESVDWDMSWFLKPLLALVKQRVAEIAKDPEAYYQHIEKNLPYRQRSGKIRSRDLNRILDHHLEVENRDYCIKVMKELIRRQDIYEHQDNDWKNLNIPAPFDKMTIRTFCHYYRIADLLFWKDKDWLKRHKDNKKTEDDVEYYEHHGLHGKLDQYDLDSQADFIKFAKDHYGELGLSRMNVGATDYYVKGKWLLTFSFSYSAYMLEGLKIAMALYETGAQFIFYDAENVLHALEETGWVRLSPFTFHDYLQHGDDEGVFDLPYTENCDQEDEISRQQYDEIVKCAKWEHLTRLSLDHTIPLASPLYDSIKDEAKVPLTLSQIRHTIEKKYDTYLSAAQKYKSDLFYCISPRYKGEYIEINEKQYFHTFNEAMSALILLLNKEISNKLTTMRHKQHTVNLEDHKIGDTLKTRDGRPVVLTDLECEGIWLGQIDGGNTWYYLEDGKAFDPFAYCGNPWPEDIVGEWLLYDRIIQKLHKLFTYIRHHFNIKKISKHV